MGAWHPDSARGWRLLVTAKTYVGRRLPIVLYPLDEAAGTWRLGTAMDDDGAPDHTTGFQPATELGIRVGKARPSSCTRSPERAVVRVESNVVRNQAKWCSETHLRCEVRNCCRW
jgi:hypothetical protein